jgi:hypothetical protein
MIPNAIAERLKPQSKDDFKDRHFDAWLIAQAVTSTCRIRSAIGILRKCCVSVSLRSITAGELRPPLEYLRHHEQNQPHAIQRLDL